MTYDLVQNLLTATTELIAITGIIAHAFYTQHKRFMTTYCPSVKPYTPDTRTLETKVEEQPTLVDEPWETEITTITLSHWVRSQPQVQPTLYLLPPAQEEVKPAKKPRKTPAKPRTTRKRKAA